MKVPFIDLKTQYEALKPQIDERIQNVLNHGQFILGPEVAELETKLAEFVGCKYAIGCGSGTNALTLAMLALELQPGDEVITTPFSFFATVDTMIHLGVKPVFVDVDERTYNMDPAKLEAAITDKTKVIVPVSLYGLTYDAEKINAIAEKHSIEVIEDGAQSFGAMNGSKRSCNLSRISGTSFFPAKPLGAYGDGGAVFTNDEKLAQDCKELRIHGQSSRYHHTRIGINSRLDTMQAAVLLCKLERYQWELDQRDKWAQRYNQELSGLDLVTPYVPDGMKSAWAQYTIRVSDRDGFQKKMGELGLPTSIHYPTLMSDQPAMKGYIDREFDLSVARKMASEVISLPIFPDMNEEIQDQVIAGVKQVLAHA